MLSFFNSLFPSDDESPVHSRENTGNLMERLMLQSARTRCFPRLQVRGVEITDMPHVLYFKILVVPAGNEGTPHVVMKCYRHFVEFHTALASEFPSAWQPQLPAAPSNPRLAESEFCLRLGDYLECIACNGDLIWSSTAQSFFQLSAEYQESETCTADATVSDAGSTVERGSFQVPQTEDENFCGSAYGLVSLVPFSEAEISHERPSACAPQVTFSDAEISRKTLSACAPLVFCPEADRLRELPSASSSLVPLEEEQELRCDMYPSFSSANSRCRGAGSEATTSASHSRSSSRESLLNSPRSYTKKRHYSSKTGSMLSTLPSPLGGSLTVPSPLAFSVITPSPREIQCEPLAKMDVGSNLQPLSLSAIAGRRSLDQPPVVKHVHFARDARAREERNLAFTDFTAPTDEIEQPFHTLLASHTSEPDAAAGIPSTVSGDSTSDVTLPAHAVTVDKRLTSAPSNSPAGTELERKSCSPPSPNRAGKGWAQVSKTTHDLHRSASAHQDDSRRNLLLLQKILRTPVIAEGPCTRDTALSAATSEARGNLPSAAALSHMKLEHQKLVTHHNASCSSAREMHVDVRSVSPCSASATPTVTHCDACDANVQTQSASNLGGSGTVLGSLAYAAEAEPFVAAPSAAIPLSLSCNGGAAGMAQGERRCSGTSASANASLVTAAVPLAATQLREVTTKWQVDTSYLDHRTVDPNNLRTVKQQQQQHSGADVSASNKYADPSERSYAYELLRSPTHRPADVDPTCKEKYLCFDEFHTTFGMDYAVFAKLPKWKQQHMKRSRDLF